MRKLILALGGNALVNKGEKVDYLTQIRNLKSTLDPLEFLFKEYEVIITHGNGPQVGNLMNLAEQYGLNYPLHTLVAMTQASIGSFIQEVLNQRFKKWSIKRRIDVVITRSAVKEDEEVFKNPTKPIGPFITKAQAAVLKYSGKSVVKLKENQYRRVVPSPVPEATVERKVIKKLGRTNTVICCGGGGIPVIPNKKGYERIDAVVDKDLASAVIGIEMSAEELVILTNVDAVYLDFGKKYAQKLHRISLKEAQNYLDKKIFEKGSMAPKIQAAINFIRSGGKRVVICSYKNIEASMNGTDGTVIKK